LPPPACRSIATRLSLYPDDHPTEGSQSPEKSKGRCEEPAIAAPEYFNRGRNDCEKNNRQNGRKDQVMENTFHV